MWDRFDFGESSKHSMDQAYRLSTLLQEILNQAFLGMDLPKQERELFKQALKSAKLLSQFLEQAITGEKSTDWFAGEAIALRGQLARLTTRLSSAAPDDKFIEQSKVKISGKGKDLSLIKKDLRDLGIEDNEHTHYFIHIAQQVLDEIESFTKFSQGSYSRSKIIRKIKPKDEHKQVVLSILNYFGRIIQHKHEDMQVKVTTEQSGEEIAFIIEMDRGDKSDIEDTLYQYGLVVVDDAKPENLLPVSSQALELKHKLEIAKLELRHTTELLHSEREGYGTKICSLEDEIKWLRESLSEGINRVSELQEVVSNIARDSSEALKESLKVVIRKATDGIEEEDKERIIKELNLIKSEDPGMLDKLNNLAGSVFSGTSSNLLSSWITAVITAMPK